MTEQQTEEQKAVQYEVHEMALQFPAQKPDEKAQLRDSMIQRVHQGLGPLEFPILLVGGKIADGRHRYQIWQDLAADGNLGHSSTSGTAQERQPYSMPCSIHGPFTIQSNGSIGQTICDSDGNAVAWTTDVIVAQVIGRMLNENEGLLVAVPRL